MFRKLLDQGQAGDNAGLLLRGTKRDDVERGQVLAKPGSITPHTEFEAEVYVLSKDEGGRHTPFFKGYRPQFYFRTTDITGACELPEGVEMVIGHADQPGGDGRRPALRDPRRRPYRRRRRGCQDHQVSASSPSAGSVKEGRPPGRPFLWFRQPGESIPCVPVERDNAPLKPSWPGAAGRCPALQGRRDPRSVERGNAPLEPSWPGPAGYCPALQSRRDPRSVERGNAPLEPS